MSAATPYNTSNLAIYSPALIPGLSLWLDAADATTVIQSGGSVSQWNDKSGNGYNATQITLGAQPTYSNKYLYLNGVNQYFNVNLDFLAGVSHNSFIVLQNFNYQNIYGAITGGNGSNSLHIGFSNSSNYRMNYWANDWYTSITSNYKINQTNLINYFWYNNTSKTIYTNGGLEGTVNQVGIIGTMSGGGSIGNVVSQGYLNANIYEILIYPTLLTTSQRQQIEGYLAWKWGLQASLPSNHPFYYQPYLPNTVANPYLGFNPISATFPNQISGLSLWLDAADASTVLLSGSNVTQWNDKSGNGRNLTSVISNSGSIRYTNAQNYPCIFINNGVSPNVAYMYVNSPINLQNYTFYILTAATGSYFNGTGFCAIPNSGNSYSSLDGFGFYLDTNGPIQSRFYGASFSQYAIDGATSNALYSYPLRINGYTETSTGSLNSYINGALGQTKTTGNRTTTAQGFGLAVESSSGTFNNHLSNMYVFEVLVYNNVLSANQRQQIEGYLAWKWGLQVNLTGLHPSAGPSLPSYFSGTRPYQFQPTIFSGCSLWLDAADLRTIIQSAGNVTQWNDKSALSNNTNTLSGTPQLLNKGLNGYPSIYFNGSSGFYGPASNTTTTLTGFYVGTMSSGVGTVSRALSLGNAGQYDYNTTSNINLLSANTPPNICWYRNNQYINYSISYSVPFIYCATFNGTTGSLYYNGSFQGSNGSTGSFGYSIYGVGRETGSGTSYWLGNISEVILFNSALSTSQRQQIEGYLAWKWGLQKNLPTSHPYYLFPPG
jgi:hypothetical protein